MSLWLKIASIKVDNLLSKSSELISKCGHQNKFPVFRDDCNMERNQSYLSTPIETAALFFVINL